MVDLGGIEPPSPQCECDVLPLNHRPLFFDYFSLKSATFQKIDLSLFLLVMNRVLYTLLFQKSIFDEPTPLTCFFLKPFVPINLFVKHSKQITIPPPYTSKCNISNLTAYYLVPSARIERASTP